MDKNQFRSALETVGLTQGAAGDLLGVDKRTVRRWALGEVSVPHMAVIVLTIMMRLNLSAQDVEDIIR